MHLTYRDKRLSQIISALRVKSRVRILELLAEGPKSITEISRRLQLPMSTVSANVTLLERTGLVKSGGSVCNRKYNKTCYLTEKEILITMPVVKKADAISSQRVTIPIGQFTNCAISPTCGLASEEKIIGSADVPASFWEPDRVKAGLIWFGNGFLEYRIPNKLHSKIELLTLEISMELSSEHPFFRNNWPSDITLWLDGVEIGTWTAPGDFGGKRGLLNPAWWSNDDSQYGLLKRWRVNREGSYIDGEKLSETTLKDLRFKSGNPITMKLGLKPDAKHKGGLNLYGRTFGNYPQDILAEFFYKDK